MKTILSLFCLTILGVGLGCAAMSEYVTPATLDQKAVNYVVSAGVAEPNDFKGYANLEKAIRLEAAVESAYQVKTLILNQMLEKNELDHGVLKGTVVANRQKAGEREATLFGPTGLLSMGLSLLGVGGLGGVLGLMRKRPGDITPQEMESALAELKGSVTDKDRQFIEVVKGVQNYINANPGTIADGLKTAISAVRGTDTKQAIAAAKAVIG